MYPYFRSFYHLQKAKSKPKLNHPFIESTLTMRVWPWDIDMYMELNNGRYLTIMDIGRFEIGYRIGLFKVLQQNNWGLMVGATNCRFRYRLKTFQQFTLHTKMLYYDERWFYFRQWFTGKNGKIHASCLVRTAVISKQGLVPTKDVEKALAISPEVLKQYNNPVEWIELWAKSDDIHKTIMEPQT